VSKALIPNTQQDYKRLGGIINDARLAGLIDWEAIEDRTRELTSWAHQTSPEGALIRLARQYSLDMWEGQPYRVEIWVEKEALAGIFERVCMELDIPYLSCRGYTSQSEMWAAGMRLKRYADNGQQPYIFHFGDHDPSGIDMTRDIRDRLELFTGGDLTMERLALNMDQVEEYNPPPNPAKLTDSRCTGYIAEYGESSWELDALEPAVLADLVRTHVRALIDDEIWGERKAEEGTATEQLEKISTEYDRVVEFLNRDDA
jgi:hypothetical protein